MSVLDEVKRLANEAAVCRSAARDERDGALVVQFGQDAREFIDQANTLLKGQTVRVVLAEDGAGRLVAVAVDCVLVIDLDEGWTTSAYPSEVEGESL